MTLLAEDLSSVTEPMIQEKGEYRLEIKKAEERTAAESGRMYWSIMYLFPDHPEAPPIFDNLMCEILKDDKDNTKSMFRLRMKHFKSAFGRGPSEVLDNTEQVVGRTGFVHVGIEEVNINSPRRKNVIIDFSYSEEQRASATGTPVEETKKEVVPPEESAPSEE